MIFYKSNLKIFKKNILKLSRKFNNIFKPYKHTKWVLISQMKIILIFPQLIID